MLRQLQAFFFLCILLHSAQALGLQEACPAMTPQRRVPLAMVVSGGVSLGSYEAGYLYYTTELIKMNRTLLDPKIATGASAGSVNALVSIMSLCSELVDNPRESLFWDTWLDVGFRELSGNSPNNSSLSFFSRDILLRTSSKIEKKWREGLAETCDMVLGVSTTRREPLRVPIAPGFEVVRQEEKFLLRVQGRGRRREPIVSNYVNQRTQLPQPLLHLPAGAVFPALRSLLFASSAFPVAFSPQIIEHCLSTDGPMKCNKSNLRRDAFIDGGVFDNQPLRLAYRTAASGLIETCPGRLQWLNEPKASSGAMPESMLLTYLNVDSKAYPDDTPELAPNITEDSLSVLLGQVLGGFVSSARSKELYTLLESDPSSRHKIHHSQNYYPRMSDHLRSFFGFFERDFRIFDFYQGMYDARRDMVKHSGQNPDVPGHRKIYKFPEEKIEASWKRSSWQTPARYQQTQGWAPYMCMRAFYDRKSEWESACSGSDLRNFRILLQTSLDRLYARCLDASLRADGEAWADHSDCRAAARGKKAPRVLASAASKDRARRAEESDLQHTMRPLAMYQFHFRDLDLTPTEAERGLTQIQTGLLGLSERFVERQSVSDRAILKFTGKPIFNLLRYIPTESLVYLTFGRAIELGISSAHPHFSLAPSWLRSNFGLQVQGLHTLLSSLPDTIAFTPVAGFEADINAFSDAVLQWRAGLRYGYQMSMNDRYGQKPCTWNEEQGSRDPVSCTRSVVQPILSLSLWERVRFMFVFEIYPTAQSMPGKPWNGLFEAGLQL